MSARLKISIVGLGRLGVPMAACFAARGFEVVGYDPVAAKVEAVTTRHARVYESGLDAIFDRVGDRLRATRSLEDAVRSTDVTFLAVPTPSLPDGSFSLEHVLPTCRDIGRIIAAKPAYHLVVLTSTVMPGSTERRVRPALEEASGRKVGEGLGLCYSAVFVAMGTVVGDFLHPDMSLVGECDARSGDVLAEIYADVSENEPAIVRMSPFNAELTKLALNVFVTTKISFANVLARLCEHMPGGNVDVVTSAMQLDRRIGRGAMCGAIAYGGPFFARDNQAFAALMRRLDVAPELLEAMGRFNRSQIPWLADFVHERLPHGGRVGVLGLAYKPETDVVTQSPSIYLCRDLAERPVPVLVHDPAAMSAAREVLPDTVRFADSAEACVSRSDLVVIATPWVPYGSVPAAVWAREGDPRVVVDCWRLVPALASLAGVEYVPLGSGPGTPAAAGGQPCPPPAAGGPGGRPDQSVPFT